MPAYPDWCYYPTHDKPPQWVEDFVGVVAAVEATIATRSVAALKSDLVLSHLRPGLVALGYEVESGKKTAEKVKRPVLFGEQGVARVTYEVDAAHDDLGVVVEVEAGRGAQSNALYRDLIRASLIVDVKFLALGTMQQYRHKQGGEEKSIESYRTAKDQLDAIYASGQLVLPFRGVLLFGY